MKFRQDGFWTPSHKEAKVGGEVRIRPKKQVEARPRLD